MREFGGSVSLTLCLVLCGFPALAQSQQTPDAQSGASSVTGTQETGAPAGAQAPDQKSPGSISGTVVDQLGSIIVGAQVRLSLPDQVSGPTSQDAVTDDNGQFFFTNVAPGNFQLTFTAAGLATKVVPGIVHPGEAVAVPQVTLPVATQVTQVVVTLTQEEQAQVEIQEQEKQRVFGIIPNFYVTYVPDAAPLTPKQKFELAWKSSIDPFTFVAVGALAGIQQAADEFHGYGQGAQGYAKRYGADYGDVVIGTFLGSAILPSILKQDPRYFYKGTGSTHSRILYALSSPFICKGDNKRWQPNYSYIIGNFAAAGIANLYYPESDREGARLLLETVAIRLGENALSSVFQEFIVRKLTPHLPSHSTSTP
jgi:Carboxypeptidase regulatory-like domain